ncbi:MAG: hypothetical protein U5N55_12825 [Cypionkella sp.]|nr:hypothetical protein [Cypionkella sp.]
MARRFPLTGLRSVHLHVPDLAQARSFYTEVWGLVPAADENGTLYLRGYGDDPYLVALSQGDAAIAEVCWRAAPDTDLAAFRDQLIGAGARLEADIGGQDEFCGGTGFALRDPVGRGLRIVQNDARPGPDCE